MGSKNWSLGTAAASSDAVQLSTGGYNCQELYFESHLDNAVNVYWGTSTVRPFVLAPGDGMTVPVKNPSQIYVATTGSTATVAWAGFRYE
jgi:hypothetical protein